MLSWRYVDDRSVHSRSHTRGGCSPHPNLLRYVQRLMQKHIFGRQPYLLVPRRFHEINECLQTIPVGMEAVAWTSVIVCVVIFGTAWRDGDGSIDVAPSNAIGLAYAFRVRKSNRNAAGINSDSAWDTRPEVQNGPVRVSHPAETHPSFHPQGAGERPR